MRIFAETLFHGTTPEAWACIQTEGLKPKTDRGIIYLSPSPANASYFGEIILKVKIREQRLSAYEDCVTWEVLCWDPILPEDISPTSYEEGEFMLHYLTPEEESAIKAKIPWQHIEVGVRNLVRAANAIRGLATLQSCAGHITPMQDGCFHVQCCHIAFRCTEQIVKDITLGLAFTHGIMDISLTYWSDGSFWMKIGVDPAEQWRLSALLEDLKGLQLDTEEKCD